MKRAILVLLVSVIVGGAVVSSRPATGAVGVSSPKSPQKVNPNALRELLTKGLKVTRDAQKEYIDRVVSKVVLDKLPLSMVYASFRYARSRRPQFPFPYFVFSLETLAKRKKIEI